MKGAWSRFASTKDDTRNSRVATPHAGNGMRDEAEAQADRAMKEAAGGRVQTVLTPSMVERALTDAAR